MPPLDGSRALVIGGARRLGRAIALGLAEHGADVAVTSRAAGAEAEETADAIRALGRSSAALACDVHSVEEIGTAVAAAATALGGLDVLVYAAAGGFRASPPGRRRCRALRRGRRHDPARGLLRRAGRARADVGARRRDRVHHRRRGDAGVAVLRAALGREGRPRAPDGGAREGVGAGGAGVRGRPGNRPAGGRQRRRLARARGERRRAPARGVARTTSPVPCATSSRPTT